MVIKNAHKIFSGKPEATKPFKRPGMILALILKRAWTYLISPVAYSYVRDDEPRGGPLN